MQIDRRPTLSAARHIVILLALICAGLSAFTALPGWRAGAQASGNDQIAFDRDGEIFLISSDGSGMVTRGEGFGPSFSPDGQQIAFALRDTVETSVMYKMAADGTNRLQLTDTLQEHGAAWSPDGTRIAFVSQREDPEWEPGESLFATPRLYLMDVNGDEEKKVMTRAQSRTATHVIELELAPTWSPDGSQLAFIGHSRTATGAARTNIYVVNRDGSALREVTHFENGDLIGAAKISWSPDGTMIAFAMSRDIHLVSIDGQSEPIKLTNTTDRDEEDPVFSPEGGRIAYVVNHFTDNLQDGLYIMKANGENPTQILSSTGVGQQVSRPAWHPQAEDPDGEPEPSPSPKPSPEADMSISLTALPAQPQLGNNVTYTLVVKNNGPTDATDSFANFERSQNLDLVSATPAQGTCQPSIAGPLGTECITGPLAAGASTSITIVVRPTAVGEVGITGTVGAPPIDPDTNNNSQTVNVTVVPAPAPTCVPEVTSEVAQFIWRAGNQSSRNVKHIIFVRNDSGRTLNGLVHFVFDGLHESISDGDPRTTFFRTRCAEPLGRQFTSVGVGVRDLVWLPGQVIPIEVEFFNPEKVPVTYNLRIYTGPGFP
jgi:uncharacterized repeat protein (TIGR01451 family)